jgi:hypothetical protein
MGTGQATGARRGVASREGGREFGRFLYAEPGRETEAGSSGKQGACRRFWTGQEALTLFPRNKAVALSRYCCLNP